MGQTPQIPQKGTEMTKALDDIRTERERQQSEEGWTPEHDDEHDEGQMADAAACYAAHAADPDALRAKNNFPLNWPWEWQWWKPKDRRRDLVKAGALIVAEIERLDRLSSKGE